MTTNLRSRAVCRFALAAVCVFMLPALSLAQSIFTHAHMRVPAGRQAEAAQWYNNVLGGELGEIGPGPIIRHFNGFIGTMENEGIAGDGALSVIDHVGISVPNIRAALERVRELGGEIRTEPEESDSGGGVLAHVTDPWGGRFELLEEEGMPPGIHHIHLYASDADQMKDWFLDVFGGEYRETQTPFYRILYDSVWIHVSQTEADDQRSASRSRVTDHIGFRVPSLDDFRDTLEASGYEPYLRRPNPPGADLMFFEGPDGLHVEMTEPVG